MGIPAWSWFLIAFVLAVAGVTVLTRERRRQTSAGREPQSRRRWAERRGWQYAASDDELLGEWSSGAVAYFGAGRAADVVVGSAYTTDGRRSVFVFDQQSDDVTQSVIVALRAQRAFPVLVEMWLPDVPFQREGMPELFGPVGRRYAFVSSLEEARALITQPVIDSADAIGEDVTVVWLEREWVLAALRPEVSTARLEELIRDLGELADVVDPFEVGKPVTSE